MDGVVQPSITQVAWSKNAAVVAETVRLTATLAGVQAPTTVTFVISEYVAQPVAAGGGYLTREVTTLKVDVAAGTSEASAAWLVTFASDAATRPGIPQLRFRASLAGSLPLNSDLLTLGSVEGATWLPPADPRLPQSGLPLIQAVVRRNESVGLSLRVAGLEGFRATFDILRAGQANGATPGYAFVDRVENVPVVNGEARAEWSPDRLAAAAATGRYRFNATVSHPASAATFSPPASTSLAAYSLPLACTPTLMISNLPVLDPEKKNCIIALSDSRVTPQPEPEIIDDPKSDQKIDEVPLADRTLKVIGTAFAVQQVTVRGGSRSVMASVVNNTWQADLPLTNLGAGALEITAEAVGATPDRRSVYIVRLDIQSPKRGQKIDKMVAEPEPRMPDLNASLRIVGLPPEINAADLAKQATFTWTLSVGGHWRDKVGKMGLWQKYGEPDAKTFVWTEQTNGPQWPRPPYNIDGNVIGGWARLKVTTRLTLPGYPLMLNVTSDPRWFEIIGVNPSKAAVESYIETLLAGSTAQLIDTYKHIICIESQYQQFDGKVEPTEPEDPRTPLHTPEPFRPLMGPPAGLGLAQLDPATFPAAHWNWRRNLEGGIRIFREKMATAGALVNLERKRISAEIDAVRRLLPGVDVTEVTVPDLDADMMLRQTIRAYNGGFNYRFNAYYRVVLDKDGSPAGYEIVGYGADANSTAATPMAATPAWLEDPGFNYRARGTATFKLPSPDGKPAKDIKVLDVRQAAAWSRNQGQTRNYVDQTLKCQ